MLFFDTLKNILRFKSNIKNWARAIFAFYLNKLPVLVIYRDGTALDIKYKSHLWLASCGFKFSYTSDEAIVFDFEGKRLKFYGTSNNGTIDDVYVSKELDSLSVEKETVLDIGANIGDSTIYFVAKGASHVVAVEPFPYTFEILQKNIRENRLESKVTLLNQAVSADTGLVKIPSSIINSVGKKAIDYGEGSLIQKITLGQLLDRFEQISVIKCDCEGCEYTLFDELSVDALTKVEQILIEYHLGVQDIQKVLEKAGFNTRVIEKWAGLGLIIGKRH